VEEKDTIDLRELTKIITKYKIRLIGIVVVTTLIAVVVAFSLPKEYESSILMRTKSQKTNGISMQAASALAILGGSAPNATQSYIELMKSRSVLEPVIAQLTWPKEPPQAADFAKSTLQIQNTKGTDLIEVKAKGRTPEEAQMIVTGVIDNFQQLLTAQSQSEQSLMVKFLTDRLAIVKKDMEQAEQNLEAFRQQSKVFVPDEQAKASIKKLTDYDQKLAQIQVQNEADQAKLQGVNSQLAKQNIALAQYGLSDNPEIEQLRSTIVTKQIALIGLQQKYTDKHPNVILAQKEIDELNSKMQAQVDNSIQAGTNTLNPVQGGLLKDKVMTETELLAGQASVDAIQKIQSQNEQEISQLSASSLTYIGLERQAKITQEVYTVLIKNYEQAKIQEAMESMDIQVIDPANLPVKPSGPNKRLIAAIGGVIGVMIAFGYTVFLYSRKPKNISLMG
jgi:succinoglycan biosynthesis transport protein ExoP